MNSFLQELCDWLNADRLGKKVLFVRNTTVGRQLLRMAANHGVPVVNTSAMSVGKYINQLAEGELVARGLQKIDAVTAAIGLQQIMADVGEGQFTTMGQVELTTASRMLPQLEELEQNGIVPSDLNRVGQPLLGKVWSSFLAWKKENGYVSESELLEYARIPEGVRFAVLSDLSVSKTEEGFLSRIPSDRLTVIRFAVPAGVALPRNAVFAGRAGLNGTVDSVDSPVAADLSRIECVDCQDIGTEVRAAFQRLAEEKIPGDSVVFVCPDENYGMRVTEEGKLLGIKADSAFGVPAAMTHAGLLIRCMLEWAAKDYDAEILAPALISGSMAVYDEKKNRLIVGQEMLRCFRESQIGWGKERWKRFSDDSDAKVALAASSVYGWVRFFDSAARPVRTVAGELTSLIHESLRHGDEYELYLRIVDEISRIYPGDMTGREFLEIVQEIAGEQRVGAKTEDRPGFVYCCSYENAMYVDRPVFVMLGMSWDAFNKQGSEFPLLHDDEKEQLSNPCRLRLVSDRAREKQCAVLELLVNRPDASVVFSYARADYIGGEGIMAAGLFDDAVRTHDEWKIWNEKKQRFDYFAPQINILDRKPLMASDVYMRCGYQPLSSESDMDEGRREFWKRNFEERIWSATSMLEIATSCPRRFTFGTQMGVREERPEALERNRSNWLSPNEKGNMVHEILECYFRETAPRVDAVDEARLERLIGEKKAEYLSLIPEPANPNTVDPDIEWVRKIVKQVAVDHARDRSRETVGTEVPFGKEEDLTLEFGPYRIHVTGMIDRVDKVSDGYEIIDYKTGSPHRFRKERDRKLQYYLYTLAWEKLNPDKMIVRASYELLDGPKGAESIVIPMTEEERALMYRRMTDLLEMLSDPETAMTPVFAMETADGKPGECDDYCPYQDICFSQIGIMLGDELKNDEETDEDEEE